MIDLSFSEHFKKYKPNGIVSILAIYHQNYKVHRYLGGACILVPVSSLFLYSQLILQPSEPSYTYQPVQFSFVFIDQPQSKQVP